jgi:hypothetical protein
MNNITRYANFESRIVSVDHIINYSKKKKGFDLPPSQREKEWVQDQNAKFIYSIFENKPLGSFIFNVRGDKTYILDGQHRINALELFVKDDFGIKVKDNYIFFDGTSLNAKKISNRTNKNIISLTDDEKQDFTDTEIFIREYKNLSDEEMADIIDSINEGIKNDNVNVNKNNNNNDNKISNLINDISQIIFNKNSNDIKDIQLDEVKKYIAYVGTIIVDYENYESSSDYKQLNRHHVKRFFNNLLKDQNIDQLIKDILKFIKVLFSNNLLKHDDIISLTDKYEINNYYTNCLCYKVYELYFDDISLFNKNIKKIKQIIEELINNYYGTQFKDLVDCFNVLVKKHID